MRLLIAIPLAVLVAFVSLRFTDGPIGPLSGGPFRSGIPHTRPEVDWNSLSELRTVELQLLSHPRSRTTNFLVYSDVAYIPCGIVKLGNHVAVGQAFWKTWPDQVLEDPRIVLRAEGVLYQLTVTRIRDKRIHDSLTDLLSRKYEMEINGPIDMNDAWFYRLDHRDA